MAEHTKRIHIVSNIYGSPSKNKPSEWIYTNDNNENTQNTPTYTVGSAKTFAFRLDETAIPTGAQLKKATYTIIVKRVDSGGSLEFALGVATDITYNAENARTKITDYVEMNRPKFNTKVTQSVSQEITQEQSDSIMEAQYKILYFRFFGQMEIYEFYVDITYEADDMTIYAGDAQAKDIYVGATKAKAVYVGTTKVL